MFVTAQQQALEVELRLEEEQLRSHRLAEHLRWLEVHPDSLS